ncbi:type I restriction-modification system subunit M [Hymenobacter sp. BT635]|uniref:site-specific DNA-methyltransferase (adenine-specific) n=1 Tax=Hymenobacter nitidus TaxID=2880929 RepID=A0ABS8AA09_9BACT|nr:class I SAM-dependent DNA methyltransferase [Hymenobacter nitidus]MCB2377228.1 type I restriction-modification system subunit M [Hymenobacter nitidus]
MNIQASQLVQRVWNYATVLRDDGVGYGDYVEQITFLLFLKMADEQAGSPNAPAVPAGQDWASLRHLEGDALEVQYRHLLTDLGKQPGMLGVIFKKAQNKIQNPARLRHLIALIDKENWSGMSFDVKGEIYEGLLQKNAEDVKGGAGQYFTPRPLIQAMVDVVAPRPGQTICDPACGTAGFLLVARDYLVHHYEGEMDRDQKRALRHETFYGFDIVDSVVRLAAMNLYLHGVGGLESPVRNQDSLASDSGERFDLILANPPFGKKSSITVMSEEGQTSRDALSYERTDFVATTSNKQLNFLQHIYTILKVNGTGAVVLPDNVLFEGGAGETIRRKLLKDCDVHTLLRLPTGIFYAQGVKANVLFFTKKTGGETARTNQLWVYDLRTNQHFTLKTNPLSRPHLDDFVQCYGKPGEISKRVETERFKSFTYDELLARDKVNLDIFWLKDETLEDSASLPAPDILAQEILENLQAALAQFSSIAEELETEEV